jgi:hypothetical protein
MKQPPGIPATFPFVDPAREKWAREECARLGLDPDELCADGGVEAWMIVEKESRGSDHA